jgi:hypothetical protein
MLKKKTYLGPSPISLLHGFGDGPLAGVGAFEDVFDHHFRGEGCGDVEDFEVAVSHCRQSAVDTVATVGTILEKKIKTHNDFPVCLSSQTLEDLLKMCSFVCSAGNM